VQLAIEHLLVGWKSQLEQQLKDQGPTLKTMSNAFLDSSKVFE
jgi:hypothetical protein